MHLPTVLFNKDFDDLYSGPAYPADPIGQKSCYMPIS